MTIDEELTKLEESLRRLKIDYDSYFGGGLKRPPLDADFRVQAVIKKYLDNPRLNYAQRFRLNSISQRYATFSDLWRQKLKIKEEGYRRPQDALLGITGMRLDEHYAAEQEFARKPHEARPFFAVEVSDVAADAAKVQALYQHMIRARERAGAGSVGSFESFRAFVKKKTDQLRADYGCDAVEYSVESEEGQVRLRARAKN